MILINIFFPLSTYHNRVAKTPFTVTIIQHAFKRFLIPFVLLVPDLLLPDVYTQVTPGQGDAFIDRFPGPVSGRGVLHELHAGLRRKRRE